MGKTDVEYTLENLREMFRLQPSDPECCYCYLSSKPEKENLKCVDVKCPEKAQNVSSRRALSE